MFVSAVRIDSAPTGWVPRRAGLAESQQAGRVTTREAASK